MFVMNVFSLDTTDVACGGGNVYHSGGCEFTTGF